jgi:hypothetical protein
MAGVSVGLGDVGAGASGAPPLGGADAEMGALLGEGFDLAGGDAPDTGDEAAPAGEAGNDSAPPYEAPAETPGGEAPVATAPGSEAPAPDVPWKLAPDGQSYLMPKGDLARVQAAQKFHESVGQIFANPMEAQNAAVQASDMRQMFNDWQFGQPEALRSVMAHLAGTNHTDPTTRAAYQRSFTQMAQMAPDMLRQINPQAYTQLVSSMGKSLTAQMYEKAAQTQNPQDLMDAQSMDWALTGQYQKELPKADPAARERAEFERQRNEFNERQKAAINREVDDFSHNPQHGFEIGPNGKVGKLDQRVDAAFASTTGGDLAKFKAKYGDVAYADMKDGIKREVATALRQTDWWTEHTQTYQQLLADYRLMRSQNMPVHTLQPRVQSYINDFLSRASRVLPAIAQKRINATTQARLGRSASAPKPAAENRPAPAPNNGQPPARLTSDQWDKRLAEAMRV